MPSTNRMEGRFVDLLAEQMEIAASRRERINEKFDDERNLKTARALRELATYVRGLTKDHPSIAVLEGLWDAGDEIFFWSRFDHEVSRFRYNDDEPFDDFLKGLAKILMAEFHDSQESDEEGDGLT